MDAVSLSLLNETIQRAYTGSPYYRRMFAGLDLAVGSKSDLSRFPLLSREAFASCSGELLAEDLIPATVGMTGGSTFVPGAATPLLFYKSAADVDARERLACALGALLEPRPLILHLVNMGHGLDPGGSKVGCFQVPLERPHHFAAILHLLRQEFSFPDCERRISVIAGPLRLLKALTVLCVENGIDETDFAVRMVVSSSDQLTSQWRSTFAGYWHAEVADTYGLSEVPGLYASRCGVCGYFHFSPFAICEVLELGGLRQVERGVGRLVATALHPLSAMQPVIRYDTQDVIEILEDCPATDSFSFEFLGRLSQCATVIQDGRVCVLLASTAVTEILDSLPEVSRHQHNFARILGIRTPVGEPEWSMKCGPEGGSVTRMKFRIALSAGNESLNKISVLHEKISDQFIGAAPYLGEMISTGSVQLQIEFQESGHLI